MNRTLVISMSLLSGLVGGCVNLAPATPEVDASIMGPFPVAQADQTSSTSSLIAWNDIILDDTLRSLVTTALSENRSVRGAMADVRAARAQAGLAAAARLPTIAVGGSVQTGDTFEDPASPVASGVFSDSNRATLGMTAYELDLFGRVASLSDAAAFQYMARLENARALEISLISSIAQTWLTLAADVELLELAESTAESQGKSLELTNALFEGGVATELDKRRASAAVQTARAQAAGYRATVRKDLNALALLVGASLPDDVMEAAKLSPSPVRLDRWPGQSSAILLERPDVKAAEQSLKAANANIGAARAAFFPAVSLTGSAGYASADLSDLVDPMSGGWSFGPSISIPIFNNGRLSSNLAAARATQDSALAAYEGAIQAAFRDVSDALAVAETIDERIDALSMLVEDTTVTLELSGDRFRAGVDSYLSVLDAQRSDYSARQQLISARLAQALNIVAFYRALGAPPAQGSGS